MNEWDGPQTPAMYEPMPRGLDALFAELDELKRQVREMRGGNLLKPAGLSVDPGGLTIESALVVLGNMVIQGTLSLPAGIIDNDALASPVRGGQAGLTKTNFPVTATATAVSSTSIAVPAGFTNAVVFCSANVSAYNNTGSSEYLYVGAQIAPISPVMIPSQAAATTTATSHGSSSRLLTGLNGGSIGISALARSAGGTWGAYPGNVAIVDAIALFYRG